MQRWALDQTSIWTHLLASCLAGALATVVCNPLDMIKARMMQVWVMLRLVHRQLDKKKVNGKGWVS